MMLTLLCVFSGRYSGRKALILSLSLLSTSSFTYFLVISLKMIASSKLNVKGMFNLLHYVNLFHGKVRGTGGLIIP